MQEVAKAEQKVYILEVSIKKKSRLEGKIAKYQLRLRSGVDFIVLVKFNVNSNNKIPLNPRHWNTFASNLLV